MEGWRLQRLKEVCIINPPKKDAKSIPADALASFMPMGDLGIDVKNSTPIHKRPIRELIGSYTYFRENEVLLAKITPCFENGKLSIARGLTNQIGFGSSEYIVFRPNNVLDPEYLYYFLSRQDFRTEGVKHMSGAVGHKRVSKTFIENTLIPLPPLPVQKAIVAKLDAAFASIDISIAAAERNAENADKLYKNEVDSIFNNFSCELPELGHNAEISYGFTANSSSQYDGPHYLRITDIQNNDVNWNDVPRCMIGEKEFNKFKLTTGDIVFARTGATTGKSFLLSAPPPAVFASYLIKVAANKSVLKPEFIYQYFQSASYWDFVNAGISGAAQGGFNASKLSSLPIPLPPLDEQDIAVERLLDFQSHTKQLAEIYIRKAKAMTALKQSLLQQAFTGQLVDA